MTKSIDNMKKSIEIFHLQNLEIIEIIGKDTKKFLQGLITNDINKISNSTLIFSCLLTANSRFIEEFFITEIFLQNSLNSDENLENEKKILIICPQKNLNEIIKKLNFFRLRNQVKIQKNQDLEIIYSFQEEHLINLEIALKSQEKNELNPNVIDSPKIIKYKDPRAIEMGYFGLISRNNNLIEINNKNDQFHNFKIIDNNFYHQKRIENKICEGEFDLEQEKSFIQEFGYENLSAIDFNKGCYVGQEIIARTHYRGEIRKKIFYLKFELNDFNFNFKEKFNNLNFLSFHQNLQNNLFDLTFNSKACGKVLSCVFIKNKNQIFEFQALAQIKFDENFSNQNLSLNNLNLENLKKDLKINGSQVIFVN